MILPSMSRSHAAATRASDTLTCLRRLRRHGMSNQPIGGGPAKTWSRLRHRSRLRRGQWRAASTQRDTGTYRRRDQAPRRLGSAKYSAFRECSTSRRHPVVSLHADHDATILWPHCAPETHVYVQKPLTSPCTKLGSRSLAPKQKSRRKGNQVHSREGTVEPDGSTPALSVPCARSCLTDSPALLAQAFPVPHRSSAADRRANGSTPTRRQTSPCSRRHLRAGTWGPSTGQS